MNKSRIIGAIDIGSSKVATLIAQVSSDEAGLEHSINIIGAAGSLSKGVRKGQIVDIEEAVEATILSVEAAERMAGYNLGSAYLSVGGGHIQSQNSTGVVAVSNPDGEIIPEDVTRVIEAARAISQPTSREVIHVIPREFMVDGESQVKDPVGMTGVRLEVETHIISASSPALKNLSKTVNEVGVNIEGLIFSGLASAESVLSSTEKELGCIVVDIGGGTTSVTAFVDSSISYSGTIPIGGRNVTNDIAIGLRVPLETAEKIKVMLSQKPKNKEEEEHIDLGRFEGGETKKVSRRTLTEGIIKPRLNEIFTMVKMDLERSRLINRVPSGVVLTGGGALTVGALDSAKRVLALPVRLGKPSGVAGLVDDILNPAYAGAIGMILFGAKEEARKSLPSFGKRFKLPAKGTFGKILESIKDLLP